MKNNRRDYSIVMFFSCFSCLTSKLTETLFCRGKSYSLGMFNQYAFRLEKQQLGGTSGITVISEKVCYVFTSLNCSSVLCICVHIV